MKQNRKRHISTLFGENRLSLKVLGLLLAFMLILVAGCAPPAAPAAERVVMETVVVEKEVKLAAPAMDSREGIGYDASLPSTSQLQEDALPARMIIRTGNLSLVVKDTAEAMDQVRDIVNGLEGYVVESNAYLTGEVLRGTMTVRVPAKYFDSAFEQLQGIAVRVQRQNTSGQDVTEEFTDLSARKRNLEATESELVELLATVRERTGKAEDILAVHREITQIRGQIEQIQGRMQYLERMTAMSTISIEFIPDELGKPIVEGTWQPGVTLRNASRAVLSAFQTLVDILIWVIVFILPIVILFAIPILVIVLLIRRGSKREKSSKTPGN